MYENIKKVHVIFKTHLDIGYTDLSSNVLKQYVDEHIPKSIELAEELNKGGKKVFIWTVGSFIIDYFMTHASDEWKAKIESAISKGYISWHGIATTTHTELMDRTLMEYSLDIASKLDKKYGKKTTGAKMTDVPGHTIAMVPFLARKGIKYIHLGINYGSKRPEVPELFVWKNGEYEVIVHYSNDYGTPLVVDGFDEAVEYAYTGDNTGPQNGAEIAALYEEIQQKYPNAKVFASTISDFAEIIYGMKEYLPTLTEEIGDTWIHGVGTDPYKMSCYYELLSLKEKWLKSGKILEGSYEYHDFMTNLFLVVEHTCSVDIKKYLFDFTNWTKEDFNKARENNLTDLDFIPPCYDSLKKIILTELGIFRNGEKTGSYSVYEKSQEEQLEYIRNAVLALPAELKDEAQRALDSRTPHKSAFDGDEVYSNAFIIVGDYKVKINSSGALNYLDYKGRNVIRNKECAKLSYEIFDAIDVKKAHLLYNRNFKENLAWTEGDYAKPGLEVVGDLHKKLYEFSVYRIIRKGIEVTVFLKGDEEAAEKYGCPKNAELIYYFGDTIRITLNWFDKEANRIPEAIWLGFNFDIENPHLWMLRKIDSLISPYNVVSWGNRKQHCTNEISYDGADEMITLKSMHAPLVSVGGRNVYELDNKIDDLENGFYYNLFNNRWGTNYKTWCEDDVSLDFEIAITNK